jgi:hypothetical protein
LEHLKIKKMKFEISDKELEKYNEWKEKIKDLYGEYGLFTFSFTPNGIGSGITVKSHLTGLEIDITDIDSW